ncbi:C-Maf-inducing protein isoform X4 [Megachile rotundata]
MDELKVKPMEEKIRRSNNDEEENKETGLKTTDTNKGFSTYPKYTNRTRNTQEMSREFQGNCYNCNRYGHSAKNCYSKSHNRSNDTHKTSSESNKRNHAMVEMARCLILQGKLTNALWVKAINTSVYLRNRCPTKINQDTTPYEEWTGQKPYIGFLRKIGSRVIALKKGPRKGHKFEPRGKEYVLVGHFTESKAYRLWEQGTKMVIIERDVRFIEEQNIVANEGQQQPEFCPMEIIKESREDSAQQEEEELSMNQDQIDQGASIKRRGRPRIERTGKSGRPRKIQGVRLLQTGFLQQPIPYSNMSDIRKYAVARWDPTYKNCISIVLSDSSLLLQANNAYTRDQWYHSILWKRSIFKYQLLVSLSTQEEAIIKELKSMVDFALWTSLQDERVTAAPLEAAAKLLDDSVTDDSDRMSEKSNEEISRYQNDRKQWAEAILSVVTPLLDKVALPACLAKVLAKLAEQHPQSPLVFSISPAITRCLKHTVDFGKSPDMRRLLQVFLAALHASTEGEQIIRDYVAAVHGPGSDCPHPRVLPNLVSVCVAAIFHRFEVAKRSLLEKDKSPTLPPLDCYLLVLNVASEYSDWRPGFGALLQPVPFPEEALAIKEVQQSILMCVIKRLAKDSRCIVHRVLLPVREPRPGWIHIAAPSSPACPDEGELFGEMLTTLLDCCCRRKRFIASLVKQARDDCILLAVRNCEAAQEALCLMLEWYLLPNEEARLQIVNALESTTSGKNRYIALCQRQRNLQELQQKGGPRKLTLPVRATDADVALLLGGRALGNLECLSLAFTSVTSACAEQLIKLPALRYLNLWATQFGDAGLQMISEHLQKLQVLNLCETPVSDKGISTLASLTSLRKLNLNSTKLSVQTFESLKKCLPSLQEFDVRYTEAW